MKIILTKVRRFAVCMPKGKSIETDCIEYANKKAILGDGKVFERVRLAAIKRLQRKYFVLASENKLPLEIDYPDLIKIVATV